MVQPNRYVVAAGAFTAALSIGYVMQNTVDPNGAYTARAPAASAEIIDDSGETITLEGMELTASFPAPPVVARGPATLPDLPLIKVSASGAAASAFPEEESVPGFSCPVEMSATPGAAAMVDIVLTAPCKAGERVTLHHSGMMITESVDSSGVLSVTLPALTPKATFIASFSMGEGAVTSVEVPSLTLYDRVALQWQGETGLQIHAREFGADYGDPGHVSADSARDVSVLIDGDGGFLTRHGNDALGEAYIAEVYTFPIGSTAREGVVDLSVEAEVTASSCGREIEAQSLQVSPGDALKVREISLTLPGCDAVGDFLVLNNLLDDLKIALN